MVPEMGNIAEPMAGFYEGSAEISSDLYSIASFIYNDHLHSDIPASNRAGEENSPVGG